MAELKRAQPIYGAGGRAAGVSARGGVFGGEGVGGRGRRWHRWNEETMRKRTHVSAGDLDEETEEEQELQRAL